MIKNYLLTAWRNLVKSKAFSLINISGLTIGITVCMMIFLFIKHEFSADRFLANGDRIYRVMRQFRSEGKNSDVSYLSGPYAPALMNDFGGQLEKIVRVNPTDNLVTIGTQAYHEKKVIDTDPNFFDFFSYPLVKGDKATVLKDPGSVVLSESIAKKYFGGTEAAMGKTILMDKNLPLKVSGVMKDIPSESHLDFDMVVPLENYRDAGIMKVWINNGLFTYLQLKPNVNPEQVQKELPAFVEKYLGEDQRKYGFKFSLSIVPLKDVYFLNAAFDGVNVRHGDRKVVFIFISIAALILLIACINFMNLSTIRAAERSKEVGLRKVLGALRQNLIWQFIGESILITLISSILSVGLVALAMPWYENILGYKLPLSENVKTIAIFLAGIILVVGFLAGSYPAFFLSSFSPIQALKGKLRLGKGGASFRQALVVVQFSITVFLLIGTISITRQMRFVQHQQLGYDKEQTVIVPIDNNDIYEHRYRFKKELERTPGIASVSLMSGEPGGFFDSHMFDVEGRNERWIAHTEFSDFEFAKTLGLKVVAGRDFSPEFPTDSGKSVMINETAAKRLGWTPEQAIGKWIQNTVRDSARRQIVGVVKDFNFQSLKENLEPLVISTAIDQRQVLIKVRPGNIAGTLSAIGKTYASAAPVYPFTYTFLDQQFGDMYRKDLRQQAIITVFAGLAILVACLGLLGLASFTATKRFREIGVRKVLGSSVQGIVVLLSRDLLKPVAISLCIAVPAGYYAMSKWMESFAYRSPLSWWIFALAAAITFSIALATICLRSVGAAMASPIKSLRTE